MQLSSSARTDVFFPRVLCVVPLALAMACNNPAPAAADDAASSAPPAASTARAGTSSPVAPSAAITTGKRLGTPAGTLAEVGDEIQLSGKTVYPPECPTGGKDGCAKVQALRAEMEGVKIIRHFDGPDGPQSVVLFQVTTTKVTWKSNACSGGPLFFVRFSKDASPVYSDVIEYCGGPDPIVDAMPDKIVVNAPEHRPFKGTLNMPATQTEYDVVTGTLRASAPTPRKKRFFDGN